VPTFQTFTMPSSPAVPRKSFPATCNMRSRRRRRYQAFKALQRTPPCNRKPLRALVHAGGAHMLAPAEASRGWCYSYFDSEQRGAGAVAANPTDAAAVRRRLQQTVSRCAMQCSPRTVRIPARTGRSEPRQSETALVTGAVSRCAVWDPIPSGSHGIPSGNGVQSGGSASDPRRNQSRSRASPTMLQHTTPGCNILLHVASYQT
jgi:hypothetical protein